MFRRFLSSAFVVILLISATTGNDLCVRFEVELYRPKPETVSSPGKPKKSDSRRLRLASHADVGRVILIVIEKEVGV